MVFAGKFDGLNQIPKTHMVEEKNQLMQVVSDHCTNATACVNPRPQRHTHTKINVIKTYLSTNHKDQS